MADHAGVSGRLPAGVVVPARTGTTASDTVPVGATVLWRNSGAGAHTVTLTTSNTTHGLAVADQVITMAAGETWASYIQPEWGDANGRVAVAISGTAAEVLYYITGV